MAALTDSLLNELKVVRLIVYIKISVNKAQKKEEERM